MEANHWDEKETRGCGLFGVGVLDDFKNNWNFLSLAPDKYIKDKKNVTNLFKGENENEITIN